MNEQTYQMCRPDMRSFTIPWSFAVTLYGALFLGSGITMLVHLSFNFTTLAGVSDFGEQFMCENKAVILSPQGF